jgi:hypothetical protein
MAHGTIHPRGEHEPDIELELMVHRITHWPRIGQMLAVSDPKSADPDVMVDLEEQYVDYMHELRVGEMNTFLVPRDLAVEKGLVEG